MPVNHHSGSAVPDMGDYPASIAALSDQGDLEFIATRLYGTLDEDSIAGRSALTGAQRCRGTGAARLQRRDEPEKQRAGKSHGEGNRRHRQVETNLLASRCPVGQDRDEQADRPAARHCGRRADQQ